MSGTGFVYIYIYKKKIFGASDTYFLIPEIWFLMSNIIFSYARHLVSLCQTSAFLCRNVGFLISEDGYSYVGEWLFLCRRMAALSTPVLQHRFQHKNTSTPLEHLRASSMCPKCSKVLEGAPRIEATTRCRSGRDIVVGRGDLLR